MALSTTLNGVLTYFAVLKWQLGIAGAAWATVFSIFAANGFVLFWMARNRDLLGPSWSKLQIAGKDLQEFRHHSANMVLRTGTLTLAFFLLMTAATRLGPMTLAAHQIMLQLWLVTSFAVDGFALTASSLEPAFSGKARSSSIVSCAVGSWFSVDSVVPFFPWPTRSLKTRCRGFLHRTLSCTVCWRSSGGC